MWIKKNKYLLFGLIIMFFIVVYSFYSFYSKKFEYRKYYYEIENKCYKKKSIDDDICKSFKSNGIIDEEKLEKYILENNPKKVFKSKDVITVCSEIVELSFFNNMQFFSPLIIIFVVIGSLYNEFISGNFKNYYIREKYSNYLKRKYLVALKSALIIPFSLILIFLIACFMTNFNFNTEAINHNLAVYDYWKYNNFFLYGIIILVIQYLISLLYANIAIFCLTKNKNMIVSIIMSYIAFILVDLFIYIILYILIINKLLGFKELTEYFNITGYWFFSSDIKLIWIIILSFVFQFISFMIIYSKFRKKEGLMIEYEKKAV